MFSQAYVMFSVPSVKSVWEYEYPECWVVFLTCAKSLGNSVIFAQLIGIMYGQLVLGFLPDNFGRRVGSLTAAALMLFFGILVTASSGSTQSAQFAMFATAQSLFGVGAGGESSL